MLRFFAHAAVLRQPFVFEVSQKCGGRKALPCAPRKSFAPKSPVKRPAAAAARAFAGRRAERDLLQNKRNAKPNAWLFFLPKAKKAGAKRTLLRRGAGDRDRTGTGVATHGILSPGRLPISPLRQLLVSLYQPPCTKSRTSLPHPFPGAPAGGPRPCLHFSQ